LRCRGKSCQSGSQARPYESVSPRGRAHTMRERPRGGLPSELRREYRRTAHAPFVSSRPSASPCQLRPPNAPRDRPTRGALWLRRRGPQCQSGSQTRPYESVSPHGRPHTMRERTRGGPAGVTCGPLRAQRDMIKDCVLTDFSRARNRRGRLYKIPLTFGTGSYGEGL
jgi:hypothetical protein